jgi:hypothetical protein
VNELIPVGIRDTTAAVHDTCITVCFIVALTSALYNIYISLFSVYLLKDTTHFIRFGALNLGLL